MSEGSSGEGAPAFSQLSEAEQRAVAERLLKIEESGWKPFWCPNPHCSGDPHPLLDEHGAVTYMEESAQAGPNGEPLGPVLIETEDGEYVERDDPDVNWSLSLPVIGRAVLNPKWAHNHARKDQRLPAWNKRWTLFIMSGRGCIAPWTLIDLADGARERVDVLAERGEAVEVMTPDGPRWTDGAPFMKGEAHQWRVRLSTGRVLTVTDRHRFLAPGGWLPLDHVRVGQPLVAAPLVQSLSDGRPGSVVLSEWREDAQRCWGTELGCGCGCPTCRRRGGLPLPQGSGYGRGDDSSRPGEDGYIRLELRLGDQDSGQGCNLTCPRSDPPPRSRSVQGGPSRGDDRSRDGRGLGESLLLTKDSGPPSLGWTDLQQPTGVIGSRPDQRGGSRRTSPPARLSTAVRRLLRGAAVRLTESSSRVRQPVQPVSRQPDIALPALATVEEIEYSHFGPFYDLTVPGTECYHSEGVVSHNSGKTRTGVEFVTLNARKGLNGAIIGRRGEELVNTHVAEILANAHPEFTPEHQVSKNLLLWPNGAITYLFSAERPENIRSVNLSYAWLDEAAHMDEVETAWMNTKFATRVKSAGNPIHFLITSTPTGTPWVMKMEDDPDVEVRRVSTYANRRNLDPDFLKDLEKEYEGTRMGRQELHGEVLRDVEGALWSDDLFQHIRVDANGFEEMLDSMDDRVLAVDPAGSKGPRSDATGIIGAGVQHTDDDGTPLQVSRFYVLGRATIKGSPTEWAAQTFKAARLMRVNRIVVEKNFGGEMVRQTLRDYAEKNPLDTCDENGEAYKIDLEHAAQSKETRAEPTVAKYEQGRVTHVTSPTVFGDLSELEKQQVNWVPKSRGGRLPSPNDIDALVWCIRALESKIKFAGQMASQRSVMSKLKRRAS